MAPRTLRHRISHHQTQPGDPGHILGIYPSRGAMNLVEAVSGIIANLSNDVIGSQ